MIEIMSHERASDEMVTEFLLNTCLLRPQPSSYAIQAARDCGESALVIDDTVELIPLVTGSAAEFYIEPMIPHIGDIDIMFHFNNELAIPRGHPPPTQLPAEFHSSVKVFEIIDRVIASIADSDSHFPGFVYLQLRYLLTKCSEDDSYVAVDYNNRHNYLPNSLFPPTTLIHGPAMYFRRKSTNVLSLDHVQCLRCLLWPPQAADWQTRHRDYGWPDSATLGRVVSNGCDVVPVAHRQCRPHEVMGKHQHRLSFSRAEIVLINSWMSVQQIVYHMLRNFVKIDVLRDDEDNPGAGRPTLSNYHIKTLLLWACELKPRSWWTDDVNLVRMCVQLLHILAKWLTDGRCQHYFINNCNLIDSDSSHDVANIRDHLVSIDETWLSTWFVDNYVRKCLHFAITPHHISRLFDDVSTRIKLQNALSALVEWRLVMSWKMMNLAEYEIPSVVDYVSWTARLCFCFVTEVAKIDSRLSVYFTAVALLHVSCKSLRHGLTDDLTDILATLCGQFRPICSRHYSKNSTSRFHLEEAVKLMKVLVNKSLSTMSLIEMELSKAYLYRALRCKDSDSDSIYCLANVYLAVLYYTTGQYQTAIGHCTLVTKSQDHSQCSSHVVQGEILPKIDDDVDNMLGLAELYQSLRTAALKQQRQPQLVSVLTTELFAYYLHIKYLSVTECGQFMQTSSTDEFKRYGVCIDDTLQPSIVDVLLFLSVSQLLKRRAKAICPDHALMNASEYNTPDLVELLQESAVEHLTKFRQLEARDFGSVATIATTDFEALYAYKHGDYRRCLQLSIQNAHTLLASAAVRMPEVPTFPEFLQLMDDDIVSLTALMQIVNPKCRDDGRCACFSQLTLSLYLVTQCQLKMRYSVTSLVPTFEFIKITQNRAPAYAILDHLTLKLIERRILAYWKSFA